MAQSIATLLVVVVALVGGTALPCSAEERNVSPDGAVAGSVANSGWYTAVQVVDAATGRGVPHVCLSTVNNARYWTDSGGYAAVREPGLENTGLYELDSGGRVQ